MLGEWTPHFVGAVIVGSAIAVVRLFPKSEWTSVLLTSYGVKGTGQNGTVKRSDVLRAAGVSFVFAVLFAILGCAGYIVAESFPGMSRTNWTFAAYGFGFVLLGGVSLLSCAGMCWRAYRWRDEVPPEQPDVPVA